MRLFSSMLLGLGLFAFVAAPVSAAGLNVKINSNGSKSKNTVNVKVAQMNAVKQINTTHTVNAIGVVSNSGGNTIKGTTGSSETGITTGDVKTAITVTNYSGSNTAEVDTCGCTPPDMTVRVKGNGTESQNTVELSALNSSMTSQTNSAKTTNEIMVVSNTGENVIKDTTTGEGGDPSVSTGKVEVTVEATNYSGSNTL